MHRFSCQKQALLAAPVLSHQSKFRIDAFKQRMKPFVKAGKTSMYFYVSPYYYTKLAPISHP